MTFALACSGSADEVQDAGAAAVGGDAAPALIRDTTGAAFEFVSQDAHGLRSVEGLATECGGKQLLEFRFLRGDTGMAMVCGIDPTSQRPADYSCRPVACGAGSTCPADFQCVEGLCQALEAGPKVHSLELMARCLAELARPPRCLEVFTHPSWGTVSQVLLNECDAESLCTVPDACR